MRYAHYTNGEIMKALETSEDRDLVIELVQRVHRGDWTRDLAKRIQDLERELVDANAALPPLRYEMDRAAQLLRNEASLIEGGNTTTAQTLLAIRAAVYGLTDGN